MNTVNHALIQQILEILKAEIIAAEGCTEPIAIAYATAKATQILGQKPQKIHLTLSGNIIKNAKSVVIPNSGGLTGIAVAAAMGAVAGDPARELMVISEVNAEHLAAAKHFLTQNCIHIQHTKLNIKLYIKAKVFAGDQSASVEITHSHTNISEILYNDQVLFKAQAKAQESTRDPTSILSVRLIYDLAKTIDIALIKDLFDRIIAYNSAIAEDGLLHDYGVNMGRNIQQSIQNGFYGNDVRNKAASLAAAGSDARMGGSSMPVMTTAGSGNVGLAASLPIITYCREQNKSQEELYRGLFFSHLATIHIKAKIGRLSAYCGPMCAAGGVAGALGFINNYDYSIIANAIINTLAGVSGVLCDGANSSCAVKIANGTYAAYDGIAAAVNGNVIGNGDGIVSGDVEQTIANIAELARRGMPLSDEVILEIMTRDN